MDNTLTLRLEGEIILGEFAETVTQFNALVHRLADELAVNARIKWTVGDLEYGSAIVTITGDAERSDDVLKVIRGYEAVGKALEQRERVPYSPEVGRIALHLVKPLENKHITVIQFQTAEGDATIRNLSDKPSKTAPAKYTAYGTVKGRVETLSSRGKLRFTLYDPLFDKPVSCYLQDGQEDEMREVWGRTVWVTGRLTREPTSGYVSSIRTITSIDRVPEVEPGSYKRARGIIPWTEGDEPAEVSIRRLRDGEGA